MHEARNRTIRETAAMLDAHGFRSGHARPDALAPYLPFRHFDTPDECVVFASGSVDGVNAELYEYDSSSRDSDGNTSYSTTLLACLHHPWVTGGASITLDWKEWSTLAAAIDAAMWFPPFLFVKAIQMYAESRDPDHVLGHPEFDRLYHVHAPSLDHASRAIPPALREFLARYAFKGTVELRPGLILYALHSARFTIEGVQRTMSFARGFLSSFQPPHAHPMR